MSAAPWVDSPPSSTGVQPSVHRRRRFRVWRSGVGAVALLSVLAASPGSLAAAKPKPKAKVPVPTTTKAPVNKLYKLTASGTYDATNEGGGEKGTISLEAGVRVQRLSAGTFGTTGSGEIQVVGYMADNNRQCQTPAAGKILALVELVDYDTTSEIVALPPRGTVAFSVLLRFIAPGTGPGVGCPNGETLTFDGKFAAIAFNQAASALALKSTGETLRRTSNDPLIRYDMTFTLVPLN